MKKFRNILIFAFIILTCLALVGCGEPANAKQVAKKVDSQANRIVKILNNLDTATNADFDIKDISPISAKGNQNVSAVQTSSKQNTKTTLPKRVSFYNEDGNYVKETKTTNNAIPNGVKVSTKKVKNYSYTPKYVNSTSESFSSDNLNNYFAKIEDLYSYCSDCMCANAECENCRQRLKESCNNCSNLCEKLKDGSITLTDEQIASCNDCIKQLDEYMAKLNSSKGNLNSLVRNLKPLLNNYNSNFDNLCSCYSKIEMLFDNRIDDLNGCADCIDRLSNIISCENCNENVIKNTKANKSNFIAKNMSKNTTKKNDNINTKTQKSNNNNNASNSTTTKKINKVATSERKTSSTDKKQTFGSRIFDRINSTIQSVKNQVKSSENSTMQTKNEDKNISRTQKVNNTNNVEQKTEKNVNKPPFPTQIYSNNAYNLNNGFNSNFNGANYMQNSNMINGNYVNGFYNRYPLPNGTNIDTYATLPKNIDTYHDIYTNIDTYKDNYNIAKQNNTTEQLNKNQVDDTQSKESYFVQDNNNNNNQMQDELKTQQSILENNKQNSNLNTIQNDNQNNDLTNNQQMADNQQLTQNQQSIKNEQETYKQETHKQENIQNQENTQNQQDYTAKIVGEVKIEKVIPTPEQSNVNIENAPLPNPFDAKKVDDKQKEKINQNTIEPKNDNEIKNENNESVENNVKDENNVKNENNITDEKQINKENGKIIDNILNNQNKNNNLQENIANKNIEKTETIIDKKTDKIIVNDSLDKTIINDKNENNIQNDKQIDKNVINNQPNGVISANDVR